jgi:hypothetical protein
MFVNYDPIVGKKKRTLYLGLTAQKVRGTS